MNVSRSLSARFLALVCGVSALSCVRGDVEDWVVLHEGTLLDDDRLSVGVGLTTQLTVAVESDVSGPLLAYSKPDGLQLLPGEGVQAVQAGDACFQLHEQPVECAKGTSVGGTLLDVTLAKEGEAQLSFISDNIDEKGTVLLRGHRLSGVTFEVTPAPSQLPSSTDVAGRLFVGSVATIRPTFKGEGLLPLTHITLPGTAPLEVVSPAGAAGQLQGQRLTLGPTPALYELKTTVRPETVRVRSYDVTGIASLAITAPTSTRVGSLFTVNVTPKDGFGGIIMGKPPSPFTIDSTGVPTESVAVRDDSVVLRATAAGTATLRVTWGSATRDVQVNVTP